MLPDITDENGRIRPEFANLPPEYWVSLVSPNTDGEGRVSFDRLGDFTGPGPSLQNRLPNMPAPGANLALSPLPSVQHNGPENLGFLEKIGLSTVMIADDEMPFILGVLVIILLVFILLL